MRMAVRRRGHGPDVVLFHGGMGSWKHWIRNMQPLSARFTVHALDHPLAAATRLVSDGAAGSSGIAAGFR